MNWLDPDEVREWLSEKWIDDPQRPGVQWNEHVHNDPDDAAVEFVKALAKASALDPEFSWGRISVCAFLIAQRLEGGDELAGP